jgi:hypothetical protein
MTSTVKWTQEDEAQVPSEQRMMVSTTDWARIRRGVERLGDPIVDWAAIWASIAIGAAIALIAIAVSIHTTKTDPHQELLTALKVSIAFCILFAMFFGIVGIREHRRHGTTSRGICDDMDTVSTRLGYPDLGAIQRPPRLGIRGRAERLWHGDPKAQPPDPSRQ